MLLFFISCDIFILIMTTKWIVDNLSAKNGQSCTRGQPIKPPKVTTSTQEQQPLFHNPKQKLIFDQRHVFCYYFIKHMNILFIFYIIKEGVAMEPRLSV